jgi:hypothetical protein
MEEFTRKNEIDKNSYSLKNKFRLFFNTEFSQNAITAWLITLSLVVNIADWVSLYIFVKPIDAPIILHYNVYFGVDLTGDWKNVYILPAIGIIIFLVNLSLARYFFEKKERIASHVIMIATLMAQLSLLIASTSIILINY